MNKIQQKYRIQTYLVKVYYIIKINITKNTEDATELLKVCVLCWTLVVMTYKIISCPKKKTEFEGLKLLMQEMLDSQ